MTKNSTAGDPAAKRPATTHTSAKPTSAEGAVRGLRRSRADVVATALRLLDEGGLAGLSMRNIANALSLQVSALYWHFPNKQSILAAVADEILSSVAPIPAADGASAAGKTTGAGAAFAPHSIVEAKVVRFTTALNAGAGDDTDGLAWREGATAAALRVREALLCTTDGAEVVASTLALGLGERDPATPIARALQSHASGRAPAAARTIATYLLGHTQHWQQRRFAEGLGVADVSPVDERREFLEGLSLLLDGVAARSS